LHTAANARDGGAAWRVGGAALTRAAAAAAAVQLAAATEVGLRQNKPAGPRTSFVAAMDLGGVLAARFLCWCVP
jgi:hypothetical protein